MKGPGHDAADFHNHCNASQWFRFEPQKRKDTTFRTFTGKVIDNTTKKPVVFANVYLIGSSLGTVTNAEGEFVLKVPVTELNRKVGFLLPGI